MDGTSVLAVHEALPGVVGDTGWQLPSNLTERQWSELGRALGRMERSVQWWIGEWWMYGEATFHGGKKIVTAPNWDGPAYSTIIACASCCKRFPSDRRRTLVPFSHHREVAALPAPEADEMLDRAQRQAEETGKPPGARDMRNEVKARRRATREVELADATTKASEKIGTKLYGVLMVDPPWRFEPYSRETGMDRAADNHYPTMGIEQIAAMKVPAADDAVLFMWATIPMLPQALFVLQQWGFTYRSACIWNKPHAGTGYWFRNKAELLLVGTKGSVPAPAPGQQYCQVIEAPLGEHSVKPEAFAEMIEDMFPTVPAIELFARAPRLGWDTWGNEAQSDV